MDKIVVFKFIEALIDTDNKARRLQLMRTFGIGPAQSTRFFRDYLMAFPENIIYDFNIKCYVRGKEFKRYCLRGVDSSHFLNSVEVVFGDETTHINKLMISKIKV